MIQAARGRALAAANTALVNLYWQLGEYISRKIESAAWGQCVVEALAAYIARRHPGLNGFTRANLFRMRQFYVTYRGDEKVAPLVRHLPWSHNLLIMGRCKRPEEREFYLQMARRERLAEAARELERQLAAGSLFERVVLNPPRASASLREPAPGRARPSSATPSPGRVPRTARGPQGGRPPRQPGPQPPRLPGRAWAATSASSPARSRSRSAARTSSSTYCSSIAASTPSSRSN